MQTSDENKEKYQLWGYLLNRYQILQTNLMRIIRQTVWRIFNEILRVKGLQIILKSASARDLEKTITGIGENLISNGLFIHKMR